MQLINVDTQLAFFDIFKLVVDMFVLAAINIMCIVSHDHCVEQFPKINLTLINKLESFNRLAHILNGLSDILRT